MNCAILCVKDDLERTVLSPALLPVKTGQFTQFFPSGVMPSWSGQDKLRKLWYSLSELRRYVCERRLGKDSSEACAIALSKLRSLLSFFHQV